MAAAKTASLSVNFSFDDTISSILAGLSTIKNDFLVTNMTFYEYMEKYIAAKNYDAKLGTARTNKLKYMLRHTGDPSLQATLRNSIDNVIDQFQTFRDKVVKEASSLSGSLANQKNGIHSYVVPVK